MGVEVTSVSWLGQLTRPVENVVLSTKGLQERNTNVGWDDWREKKREGE